MNIDEVLEMANPLGNTQFVILIATVLMNIQTALTMLGTVFLAKEPPFHCANHSGFSLEESVPFTDGTYSSCHEYSNPGSGNNETKSCTSWEFYTKVSGKSIVSEWSLVCDKDVLPQIAQSLVLGGFAFGSILGGPVADRYGRRPAILLSLLTFNVIGLSVSFVQHYVTFIVLRFLMATIFKAVRIPIMNLLFETLVPRYRPTAGLIPSSMVSGGLMIMAGIAYFVRDWRYLNAVLMIPTLIIMLFSWFIPESVRWLLSQNKTDQAEKAMQQLASFNRVEHFPSPALELTEENISNDSSNEKKETASDLRVLLQLFKQLTLTVTAILSFNWLSCGLTYYGFALSTGSLAGDFYLNFFISSSADLAGFLAATPCIQRFGTKRTLLCAFISSSGAMIGIIVRYYALDQSTLVAKIILTCLALFGRFVMSFSLLACILLMSDLFPTTMRNSGTAIVHLIGNLGSFASPLVLYSNKYFANLALIIMVCFCLTSALISLILPETVGTTQPETPADLQKLFDAHCRILTSKGGDKKPKNSQQQVQLTEFTSTDASTSTSKTNLVY